MVEAIDSTGAAPPEHHSGWFSDLVGGAEHGLSDAWDATKGAAKQTTGFVEGVGEGAGGAVVGMAKGVYELGKDGVKFATNAQFRRQVVQGAENTASQVVHHPLGTAKALGKAAVNAGENFLRGAGQAAQEGNLGEYLGNGAGDLAVNVGGFFVPGADAADAANLLGHAGEAAEGLNDVEKAVTAGRAIEDAGPAARGVSAADRAAEAALKPEPGEAEGAAEATPQAEPKRVKTFDNLEDFNRAANHAEPNTEYAYGTYSWSTDATGRVSSVEGQVELGKNGRIATDGVDTTSIGKSADAQPGDVGFHLVGDQFEGPVNRLNVVPGNGVRAGDLKSLNLSGYKKWENEVASLAREPGNTVNVKIDAAYKASNNTTRPDAFYASHQVNGGDWVTTVFRNKAGG